MPSEVSHPLQTPKSDSWRYINGPWDANTEGVFCPMAQSGSSPSDDNCGLEGYHFAIDTWRAYTNFDARFDVRHNIGHSDVGLIFGAIHSQNFYVLHFPDCGQASRAQHFWVAVSSMMPSGVLRTIMMQHVQRVASHPHERWHQIEAHRYGSRLEVCIDGRGFFACDDLENMDGGYMGLMNLSNAQIHNIRIDGQPVRDTAWTESDRRQRHWFYPSRDISHGSCQRPYDLVHLSDGQLLLSYGAQTPGDKDTNVQLLIRSHDRGRTWSQPQMMNIEENTRSWHPMRIHLTPGGRLLAISSFALPRTISQSDDDGQTWSTISHKGLRDTPTEFKRLGGGPQPFLNLRDGTILAFFYGVHEKEADAPGTMTWGASHSQAFSSQSTDDGYTWSGLTQLDDRGTDQDDKPIACNRDLTEVCAVEVENGRIMALIRPIYSPWMWETWSEDGGRSWGPCMRGPFGGYASPNMVRTTSGTIVVAHRLPGLTVHCSHDNARTWDQGTVIDGSIWAMGSMIEVEPDLVLYCYKDNTGTFMRAQFLRITDHGVEPQRFW